MTRRPNIPLLGKHRDTKCEACHKGDMYKDKLKTGLQLMPPERRQAQRAVSVPSARPVTTEKSWKTIIFDHDKKTKYPLLGKHIDTKCVSCHKGDLYKDKLKNDCFSCHEKDDKHKGEEGKKCESCHHEDSWKKVEFDHRVSSFQLTGKHILVECKKCHVTVVFKEAKSDCWSCHEKQDVHKRTLGKGCDTCHNTRDWKDWDFDHDKTKFKLDGKHKDLKCIDCHKNPVSTKLAQSTGCVSCHDKDDKHDGAFGMQCEHCHVGLTWKTIKVGDQRWLQK